MKYTVQLFSDCGNWANPSGSDVRHASNKKEAADLFVDWTETVGRYAMESDAYAIVWCGNLSEVTDCYPDWQLRLGPRGGVRWEPC